MGTSLINDSRIFLILNAFDINNIEISKPFEINFNKNEVMEDGFIIAFFRYSR